MRRITPLALFALLLSLPAWSGSPVEIDRAGMKMMIEEKVAHATGAVARHGAVTEGAFVAAPGITEIFVDCDAGRSVSQVLRTNPRRYLTIHLAGTCQESIDVERPGVTISGTLAGGAIIDPPDGYAIRALGAHELKLVDLTLTGATDGLVAVASREMTLERVRAVDNLDYGILLEASTAVIGEAELSRNQTPILVANHSTATIQDSLMEDNPYDGPFALANSKMLILNSTMLRNGYGPNGWDSVVIRVVGSTVEYPGSGARPTGVSGASRLDIRGSDVHTRVLVWGHSMLEVWQGATIGSDTVKSRITLAGNSYLEVADFGATPTIINADVVLYSSATADVYPEEPIRGDAYIGWFSEAGFYNAAPMQGSVYCWNRGRAQCDLDPIGGVHDCE